MNRLAVLVAAAAAIIAAAGWFVAADERGALVLRSEHSRPNVAAPPATVAITSEGKLYHVPTCAYIHGPARLEPGARAVADGYTPCTRCLKP